MKLYALQGKGGRGKTTTLKLLFIKILKTYGSRASVIWSDPMFLTPQAVNEQLTAERTSRATRTEYEVPEISAVIKIDETLIGICTGGGSEEEVKYALSVFKGKFTSGKACHTGFCAVLSKGATPAVVDGVKRSEKIQKACLEDCAGYPDFDKLIDKLNDWQAEELLQKVQAVVAP